MRKAIFVLLIFLSIAFGGLGFMEGRESYKQEWIEEMTRLREAVDNNNYHVTVTNVRSCILALDSDLVRFLDKPRQPELYQFVTRAAQCESFWEISMEYALEEEQASYLAESRWFYDNWLEQINEAIAIRIELNKVLVRAQETGDEIPPKAWTLKQQLDDKKEQLSQFRDKVEIDLFRSW